MPGNDMEYRSLLGLHDYPISGCCLTKSTTPARFLLTVK